MENAARKPHIFLSKWNLFLEDKKAFVSKTFNLEEKMSPQNRKELGKNFVDDSDIISFILRKK